MRVIVQVDPAVVKELHRGKPIKSALSGLKAITDRWSLLIRPLHPEVNDETLESYFVVEVPNAKIGEEAAEQLRHCRGIRAAYIKPPASLP
jgi:hypothetical protein